MLKILEKRRSSREFSYDPLPAAVLSNLLWAAFGINRPDGKRTAPSARNRQVIDIYVAATDGLYLYDAKAYVLRPIAAGDIRELTGRHEPASRAGDHACTVCWISEEKKVAGREVFWSYNQKSSYRVKGIGP